MHSGSVEVTSPGARAHLREAGERLAVALRGGGVALRQRLRQLRLLRQLAVVRFCRYRFAATGFNSKATLVWDLQVFTCNKTSQELCFQFLQKKPLQSTIQSQN